MKPTICVIGGGASGLAAAIAAARQGACVNVLEHKELPGRKILATGNGRCNLTNRSMGQECFRGTDPAFAGMVLEAFGYKDTVRFFEGLGVLLKEKENYIYPRTGQASTILDALLLECRRLDITLSVEVHVQRIQKQKHTFEISVTEGRGKKPALLQADKIILAAGGKASPFLGSDGSGYDLARSMGHTISPIAPALVQLRAEDSFFKKISGVRTDARISLLAAGKPVASDWGELQFTDYGISGIPVFQISRFAALALNEKKPVEAGIDFLPELSEDQITTLLRKQSEGWAEERTEDILSGMLHKKLIPILMTASRIRMRTKAGELNTEQIAGFAAKCKDFRIQIIGTNSFEQAQVCAGGVCTDEVCPETMESRLAGGLYVTGELLDIDGICGGYNLQWAWSTGYLAGTHAAVSLHP